MSKLISIKVPAALALSLGLTAPAMAQDVTVAVTAIVEHPALDAARDGIRDELQAQGYEVGGNLEFAYESAQGNPAIAAQIARKLVGEAPDVIVPISFNFPHSGKLLSVSFVLFAGWFSDASIPGADYARLAVTAVVTMFGSVNTAVPFLLDAFRVPADTFDQVNEYGLLGSDPMRVLPA